ncbi:dihydrofolate reductase-like [Ptychodera flava]|uniref:dihydrofolate reductase-like n=1 Tax=Ptychodera flava TaxID=63121 RepID=UPI00396A55F7
MPTKKFSPIAAACNNMGIGKNGDLPWRLRNEMKFFTRVTSETQEKCKQNAVIMGRKTWFSIPEKYRPLNNRFNVVLSHTLTDCPPGADLLSSTLDEAIKKLSEPPLEDKIDKVFITGGTSVYRESMESEHCHRIYLTRIMADFDCDTFFPEFDKNVFKLVSDPSIPDEIQEEKGIQYKFEVYERS